MNIDRTPTSQDISWFLDIEKTGRLDLNPSYQRKSVWNKQDKEFFIDTIMNNYPCPAVFIYKDLDQNGVTTYRVIDGKQRLTAIIDFSNDEFSYSKDSNNEYLANKKFSEIEDIKYKKCFWNYSIPIEQINTDNPDIIKSIFDRLNRNNKKLTPQELRNARYDGELFQFVFNEASNDFWNNFVSIGNKSKARMEDEQYISELVLLTLTSDTQGFSQDSLDKLYSDYDINFEEKDIIEEKFIILKDYINELDNINGAIKLYFRTRSNFYTLWNFLLLNINNLPLKEIFSKILKNLGDKIKIPTNELTQYPAVLQFVENTKGAATDKKARVLRLEAIEELYRNEIN